MEINFIDLILIVIFIGTILQGYARGFILSLISFAKYLVGVPLSFFIANSYNVAVYNNFVKDAVSQKISDGLSSAGDIDSFTASLQNAVFEHFGEACFQNAKSKLILRNPAALRDE